MGVRDLSVGPAARGSKIGTALTRALSRLWPLIVIVFAALALAVYSNLLAVAIAGLLVCILASPLLNRR